MFLALMVGGGVVLHGEMLALAGRSAEVEGIGWLLG